MKTNVALIAIILLMTAVSGCGKTAGPVKSGAVTSPFASFRDIPGVTAQEIAAIEALQKAVLQKEDGAFVYAMTLSTEAFLTENTIGGTAIGGYAALLCEWLGGLFGIPFRPELYLWGDLIEKLNAGEIDFAGNMTPTEERQKIYLMTDPVAERQYKLIRIAGSPALNQIALTRPLKFAFIEGAAIAANVASVMEKDTYEAVFVSNYEEAFRALEIGAADAFIGDSAVALSFDIYGDTRADDFFPLIFSPVSMATAKQELQPVISIVTKAQRNGALPWLNHLYNQGNRDYLKYKISLQLNPAEREYIAGHPVIPVVANYDNYPVCFYNTRDGEWQGIFFDLFKEITAVTGLSFKLINENTDEWPVIYEMAKSGEASLIANLTWSQERTNYFIWPETGLPPDYLALVSRSDYRDVLISEIRNVRVGIAQGTIYDSMFRQWFPNHPHTVEYDNMVMAVRALERGEVDLVMSSQRRLMFVTHYMELPGYKTNIIFEQPLQSLFGMNKNEETLCSIIDKTLKIIDTNEISERWMRKTYDYRAKVAEARMPLLIGAIALASCVVALVFIFFQRVRQQGRHLENQVRIRTAEMKAVIDNYKGVIWSVDREKNITIFGGQYLKKLGIPPSFILGKNLELARGKNRHLDIIERVDKTFTEGAQDWISEIDGGLFRSNTTPVYDIEGNVIGVVGSNDDLTELITLQRNLESAVKEAQTANRAKSLFLATMSHEMRTPMNAIIGMTTIGKNSPDIERKDYALVKIEDAAVHLLGVINDVLDISKIEANKLELSPVEFDFERMLQRVISIINFRMDEKHQKFTVNVDKKIPVVVFGDDHRLGQVILNLLSNAVKFSPENGEIGLDVALVQDQDEFCELRIEVSDNGIGIPSDQKEKLFHSFQQADSGISREFGGTGLGLSISKHIVELMGGTIWVESEQGKGSRFIFSVKVKNGTRNVVPAPAIIDGENESPATEKAGNFAGKKLLLVEDMEINREILIALLEDTEITIDCARNGLESVEMIMAAPNKYDAVLMDVQMPKMDGLEATRLIRSMTDPHLRSIPIIAMTALVFKSDIEECLAAGMNDHIGKPINIEDVMKKLQKYL